MIENHDISYSLWPNHYPLALTVEVTLEVTLDLTLDLTSDLHLPLILIWLPAVAPLPPLLPDKPVTLKLCPLQIPIGHCPSRRPFFA